MIARVRLRIEQDVVLERTGLVALPGRVVEAHLVRLPAPRALNFGDPYLSRLHMTLPIGLCPRGGHLVRRFQCACRAGSTLNCHDTVTKLSRLVGRADLGSDGCLRGADAARG